MVIGCLLVLFLAFLVGAVEALVLWAVWTFIICAIWATLPAIGFWAWFGILCAVNVIATAFRSSITVHKN